MREKFFMFRLLAISLLSASLLLGGCSDGSDGAPGAPGAPGAQGPAGPPATEGPVTAAAATDTCVVCHGDASVFSAAENHDVYVSRAAGWDVVSVVASDIDNTVVITVDIDQPGDFTSVQNVRAMYRLGLDGALTSTNINNGNIEVVVAVDEVTGNHVITIPVDELEVNIGTTAAPNLVPFSTINTEWTAAQDVTWRVRLNSGVTFPEAAVVAYQNTRVMTPVSDQGCVNCHGDNIFVNAMGAYDSVATDAAGNPRPMGDRTYHFSAYGVESCVMCHGNAAGAHGDRLMYYAHGIHASNLVNQINNEQGSLEVKGGWNFSVRYPGDLQNCSACHMTDEGEPDLTAVLVEPVSRGFCGSCHGENGGRNVTAANVTMDWDSFTWSSAPIETLHRGLAPLANCAACHDGATARLTVGEFHVGFNPEVRAADNINMEITNVVAAGLNAPIQFQWEAKQDDGTLYNACNTDLASGPVFLGNFAARIAYFQGDDIANVGVGSYGQPGATTNITATNTTCAANVATTTVNLHAGAVAERAMISFDGRPRVTIPGFANQQARVPVPSFSFVIADGTEQPRRQIVDTNKCIGCHMGNMYRHGGGRNDNIESCIACHNPSATDQGVRMGLGINASNSYDGKDAESFSMAYNMHAVHGVGERDAFYLVYRNRGLYGYGGPTTTPRNWPVDSEGNPTAYGPQASTPVFGSNPVTNIAHYLKRVNFPNRLNNCQACHFDGTYGIPDQSKALAISVNSGADGAVQTDDTLISPATAACMSCHQSGLPAAQAALRGHASQFSWQPAVIEGGKEAVLEAAQ